MASTPQLQRGLIEYDFKPSLAIVAGRIDKLGMDIRSFREPLKRSIQKVMAPSFQKNFDVGGRPAWAPISSGTMEFREIMQKKGFGGSKAKKGKGILIQSGALRQVMGQVNIWTITQESATITSIPQSVWYGAVHQAGYAGGNASPIPARPFALFQPEDEEKIAEVFLDWLDERIDRAYPS